MNIIKVDTFQRERFHIYAYCDSEGISEIDKLVEECDNSQSKSIEKLAATIERAALHGPKSISGPRCHQIDGDIYQIRADHLRVLWFYDEGNIIICTHGFIKKRNKTPRREIEKANRIMGKYFEGKECGTLAVKEERDEQGGI